MALVLPMSACGLFGQDLGAYRFRLTLSVETPDGVREASSVLEARYGTTKVFGRGEVSTHSLRGEAVFLDLGAGSNLVMILAKGALGDRDDIAWLPTEVLWPEPSRLGTAEQLAQGRQLAGVAELTPASMLTIVTIRNLADPASVEVVYATGHKREDLDPINGRPRRPPYTIIDTIPAVFGSGAYRFRSARLEMVSVGWWPFNIVNWSGMPLSHSIAQRIPFLLTHRETLRRVDRDMPPRFQTSFGQFIRE